MRKLFCLIINLLFIFCASAQTVSKQLLNRMRNVFFITPIFITFRFLQREAYKKTVIITSLISLSLIIGLSATAQAPTITSVSPASVCQGESVTITGTNFTGATSVKAGTDDAASFKVNSATSITAVVSYQSSSGTIKVTTPDGTAVSSDNLTILPAPLPALTDVSTLDIPFTNCNGNVTYQLMVANSSTQVAGQSDYDIDWGDNSAHFTQTDWSANAQISHTYNSQGYFIINLTITPKNGCKRSKTYQFYNGTNPLASFTTTSSTTGLCVPATITFKIGNWFNNSAGTTYQLDFGDGSSPLVLQHPLNTTNTDQSEPYTYTSSSCPKIDFTATLKAINGCFTTTYTLDQIIIREKPIADFNSQPSLACVSDAVCFDNVTTNGYSGTSCNTNSTYTWDFGDGSPVSNQETPPCHNYATAGSYPVTLTASNSACGSDAKTKMIIVNSISTAPTVSVTSINYCQGQIATPLAATGSGLLWYTSSGGGTGSPTAPTPSTAFPGTTIYYVTQTLTNSCESVRVPITVSVNASPNAPTVISPVQLCQNNTVNPLTASGSNLLWYTAPTGGTGNPAAPTPSTTNLNTTIYYVSQTNNNCESPRAAIAVIVNAAPSFTATSTNPTQCGVADGSVQLQNATKNTTYTVAYTQDGVNQKITLTSDVNGSITISNLPAGLYDNLIITSFGCPSVKQGPFTLSSPTAPATPTLTSNAPICSGNTLALHATTTTAGAATWNWSGPNGFVNSSPDPIISNAPVAASGTYHATVTISNCTSAAGDVTVVINPTPATPTVISNSPVCSGSSITFTNLPGGNGITYNWTGPNSFTSADQNPSIANATTAATGTYNVTATSGSCSSQATTEVMVNETPAIADASFSQPTQCASSTGSITLKGLSFSKPYTVHYTKNGTPVSRDISSDNSGNILIDGLTAGTYDAIEVSLANCSSNAKGPITLSDPNPPQAPTVSSNTPLCAGAALNLTATSNNNGTYAWSGPNSFSSTDQNPVLTNVAASNAGTYNVTLTVNNCTSPPGSTNVVINPLAVAPMATTPVEYCINTPAVPLTATATNGGTISWYEVSSGGTALPSAPTPLTTTADSVIFYAGQTSTAGCEGARIAIEVITHPDAKAAFSPLQTLGCSPFAITDNIVNLQPFPASNGSYQWYANDVLIGTGATFPGYTIQNDYDSVTIKLKTVSLFGCKDDSTAQKFYTYQSPKTAFTQDQTSGCGPLRVNFTNNTAQPERFYFTWIFGNGQTSTDINPPPVVFATNPTYGDTTYHVTLLGYTICDTIRATTDILVKSKPKALFAPDQTTGCSPMTVRFDNISKGFGTTYQWFFGDGAGTTTNDASAVEHTYITGIQDTFYAKLIATNECGTDTSLFAIVVSPNEVKLKVAINGNQVTGCAPHPVQFINRSSGASTFAWNFGDGNLLNTTKNIDTVLHTYAKGGIYTTTLFASNGCSDTTTTETITVFDKPVVGLSALPLSACIGDTISFTNKVINYSSLFWQFGDNATSTLSDPQHAYATAGTYNALLIAQKQYANGTVCSDTATASLSIVDHLPGVFSVSETVSACVPFTVTFTNTTLPSVLTTWAFGDGSLDTGDVVTHTFILPGTYNVSMQAKHPAGCLYEASKQITARGPSGSINYAAGYVCNNTPVRFESNTTNTDSVAWNFGDGLFQTTTARVVYHAFAKPGVFVPSAELISGNGCRVLIATNDTIKVDYLQAGFDEQKDVICGKTTVHFKDTSSSFFGLQNWQWNLGDGTTSALQNPIHNYTATGTLPVQLITISNSGCADTAAVALFIKVNNNPVASINGPANACDLLPVAYSSSVASIDSVSLYQWTVTPNAFYNTSSIVHTFPGSGNYNVQLVAGTVYSCYDTVVQKITVNTTPLVTASANATICRGAATALSVSGNAAQYNWQTDASLSCTACANPLAAPLSTTQYYVTGASVNGCSRTDSVLINVVQPFSLTVSGGDSICIGQSKQLTVSGASQYVWSPAATLDDPASQHPVATPPASTIYSVTGTDDHHCFTDTKTVVVGVGQYPTVSLGRDTLLSTGTIFPLHSAVTEGPIKTYRWSPATDLSCSNCAVPDANVKRPVCYSVTATNYYGCSGRDTVCIKVFCQSSQVFIANIFTPDGDGINDKLIVQGKGIALIRSFRIFNRWGQVVFEKSGFPPNNASSGWDGRINGGALASPDVYVYTCDVVCDDGTVYPLKGNVALIK